jgi:hypothetical protein
MAAITLLALDVAILKVQSGQRFTGRVFHVITERVHNVAGHAEFNVLGVLEPDRRAEEHDRHGQKANPCEKHPFRACLIKTMPAKRQGIDDQHTGRGHEG